ncbi:alpha/beta fold hydrolase [soil metagenome]
MASRTYRSSGLVLTEHTFHVPLDHSAPSSNRISVFAREVADPEGLDKPFLVFLQGGPGHEAPRPTRHPSAPGWLDRALEDYRVLMLDQRGTGRSTPVGDLSGMSPQQHADYLKHFRADSIVRDAEWIRSELGLERWSVLGQSFGGFCTMTYLSLAPEALREALITGGVAPVARPPDEIYSATFQRVLARCNRFYERYPEDRRRVLELHDRIASEDIRLPNGDRLTWDRFRQAGSMLGMSDGAERLHYLIELPADSPGFLHDLEWAMPFARNPLYAIVHEACYADGTETRWSAERVMPSDYDAPEMLTGEHVFPWMFREFGALAPLEGAAGILADYKWPALYDADVLSSNEVPCAAAIYLEDMYVESRFSIETAAIIRGMRPWITNEYEHNALRADGGRVLSRLIDLARGRA